MNVKKNILKDYLSDDDYFYIHRNEYRAGKTCKTHTHNFAEIFCVESGSGSHDLNGKTYKLSAGMLVYLKPEDTHRLIYKKGMKIINIAFPVESAALFENYGITAKHPQADRMLYSLNQSELKELCRQCEELAAGSRGRLELDSFLLNLLKGISERPEYQLSHRLKNFDKSLAELSFFSRNVSEISTDLGISREHLSREIKKQYGKSAIQLLNEARIHYAEHQLKMTNKPVGKIAVECGYSSQGQFYQVFKKITGTTPGTYRDFRP